MKTRMTGKSYYITTLGEWRRHSVRFANDKPMRAFIQDLAANHLPHIYDLLDKVCDRQGIERSPPPIRWLELAENVRLMRLRRPR